VQDSIIGRFLSADPHIPDPTNTQSYNRYAYASNNPVTLIDPSGFEDVTVTAPPYVPPFINCDVCLLNLNSPTWLIPSIADPYGFVPPPNLARYLNPDWSKPPKYWHGDPNKGWLANFWAYLQALPAMAGEDFLWELTHPLSELQDFAQSTKCDCVYAPAIAGVGAMVGTAETVETAETFFRTMTETDYAQFLETGAIPPTGETFVSPSLGYASEYEGVTVQFNVASGTTDQLLGIGVRSPGLTQAPYGSLDLVPTGWGSDFAYFKLEGGVVNIGLGQGPALEIFNSNIVSFSVVH
jgi:hypothetical protein